MFFAVKPCVELFPLIVIYLFHVDEVGWAFVTVDRLKP